MTDRPVPPLTARSGTPLRDGARRPIERDSAPTPLLGDRTLRRAGTAPGVILGWRRDDAMFWRAHVLYVVDEPTTVDEHTIVQQWVSADLLRQVGT